MFRSSSVKAQNYLRDSPPWLHLPSVCLGKRQHQYYKYSILLTLYFSPGNDESTAQSKHDTTDTEQKFGMYMKDFDFLEYDYESVEGESVDNFNWGVRRPSISNLEGEASESGRGGRVAAGRGADHRAAHHKPVGASAGAEVIINDFKIVRFPIYFE